MDKNGEQHKAGAAVDLHTMKAAEIFKVPPDKVSHDQRLFAKATNYGSKRLIDVLAYAPGSILYAEFDATDLLIEFSCKCAFEVVGQIRPYTRYFEQIVAFLNKPTSKDAARQAAYWASAASIQASGARARNAAHAALDAASAVYAARDGRHTDALRRAAHAASHSRNASQVHPLLTLCAQNNLLTKMLREHTGWNI